MEYVGKDERAPEGCILCAVIADDTDQTAHIVDRAELTFTMLNRYPYTSGHVMVIPTRHVESLTDLTEAESAALMAGATRAVDVLGRELSPGGFNVGMNLGSAAGASLPHVHLHVVPRWGGDTNFMPVLGDVRVLPEHLATTAARLTAAFGASG